MVLKRILIVVAIDNGLKMSKGKKIEPKDFFVLKEQIRKRKIRARLKQKQTAQNTDKTNKILHLFKLRFIPVK